MRVKNPRRPGWRRRNERSGNQRGSSTESAGARANVRIAILSSHHGGHLQTLLEDPVVGHWSRSSSRTAPTRTPFVTRSGMGYPASRSEPARAISTCSIAHWCDCWRSIRSTTSSSPASRRSSATETAHSYPGRIAKVHHSLLPDFPGPDPVADALKSGVKQTGVTVHMLTARSRGRADRVAGVARDRRRRDLAQPHGEDPRA